MEKLIITAAICGAEVTKEQNPAVPYTVEEIVREAKSAVDAGAAIVHLHVREDDGTPTQSKARFKTCIDAIYEVCPDVILIPSTGGAVGMTAEERLQPTELFPEMATLDCGTCNFGDEVFENTMPMMRDFGKRMLENRNKLRCLFSEKPFTPINTLTETQADEKWFNRLNEIIQENISNTEFSVDQLTRSVNMSRTLLYAKVKAVTGLTPNEFIRLVRLRKAAEYLAGNEYKINEICYMVGFNSPSYFAKCFQNQFGVLPKDFINNTN